MSGNNPDPVEKVQAELLRFVEGEIVPTLEKWWNRLNELNSELCDLVPGDDEELTRLAKGEMVPPLAWSVAEVLTHVAEDLFGELERTLRRAATLDRRTAMRDWVLRQIEKKILAMHLPELIDEAAELRLEEMKETETIGQFRRGHSG